MSKKELTAEPGKKSLDLSCSVPLEALDLSLSSLPIRALLDCRVDLPGVSSLSGLSAFFASQDRERIFQRLQSKALPLGSMCRANNAYIAPINTAWEKRKQVLGKHEMMRLTAVRLRAKILLVLMCCKRKQLTPSPRLLKFIFTGSCSKNRILAFLPLKFKTREEVDAMADHEVSAELLADAMAPYCPR